MTVNLDEIEKLHDKYIDIESWNNILSNILDNINPYINDICNSDKYLKYKINISIILEQDILNEPNAYATKIVKNDYEIVFGKKFLKLLYNYSHDVLNNGLIFEDLKREKNNTKKLYEIAGIIFYLWVEFIILHEWAHIVRGHLDFEENEGIYYEFNHSEKYSKNSIYLEMDADITAGKFFVYFLASQLSNLKKRLQKDTILLIKNIHLIMFSLFDLFFQIYNINTRNSHPSISDRIICFSTNFHETFIQKNDLFDVQEKELDVASNETLMKFAILNFKKYNLDKKNLMKDINNINNNYFKFKKEFQNFKILKF